MRIAEFDYALPEDRIAQTPADPRDSSRLLVALGSTVAHRHTRDLPELVRPGDLLVVNDTRVLPARLRFVRASGGASEVLLLEDRADEQGAEGGPGSDSGWWEALVRPSRKLPPGTVIRLGGPGSVAPERPLLSIELGDELGDGRRLVRLTTAGSVLAALDAHGEAPLPPYLTTTLADPERYQTVYARRPASAAAPTAGLHLTAEVLDRCRSAGAQVASVELVVGLDTFRPVAVDDLDDHQMHSEHYHIPRATMDACLAAERVIAIGTTTVRALESAAARKALEGRTDLFIRRGFDWQIVDLLLTNFHLPRSTLLVMIDAFVGPRWRELYDVALHERYRFLSFGDAMLLERTGPQLHPSPPKGDR
jgi:S-adenosylmethionine:tRNA ribosyltransferase-isomerase